VGYLNLKQGDSTFSEKIMEKKIRNLNVFLLKKFLENFWNFID
jgi:hypothetical protein